MQRLSLNALQKWTQTLREYGGGHVPEGRGGQVEVNGEKRRYKTLLFVIL